MYGNKQSTSKNQTTSMETSVKNNLFSNLLSAKKPKTSHTSFNELHDYLDRASETNLHEKYEYFVILMLVEIIRKNMFCGF